jgi:hypothetical protein
MVRHESSTIAHSFIVLTIVHIKRVLLYHNNEHLRVTQNSNITTNIYARNSISMHKQHNPKNSKMQAAKLAAFVAEKANRFPFNELTITETQVHSRWIALRSPSDQNSKRLIFPVLSTSMTSDAATYLIVTNQARPYTDTMSDVMDAMWCSGFTKTMPRWYHDVVAIMERFLDSSVHDYYQETSCLRFALFFITIKNEVVFRITEATKSVERGAGCVLLADWTTWFHATGYALEKSFLEVACLSFQFVSNKVSFLADVDGDCDGDSSQASYGSEGDRILHDYYVEMAEMTEMDDGCGSEDTTVSDCTIHD